MTLEDLARSNRHQTSASGVTELYEKPKKDFFGRECAMKNGIKESQREVKKSSNTGKVWVTFHEGFSNAVRKPITIEELMRGL